LRSDLEALASRRVGQSGGTSVALLTAYLNLSTGSEKIDCKDRSLYEVLRRPSCTEMTKAVSNSELVQQTAIDALLSVPSAASC
jgi:DNA-binding GntR family transcriptional regulator